LVAEHPASISNGREGRESFLLVRRVDLATWLRNVNRQLPGLEPTQRGKAL